MQRRTRHLSVIVVSVVLTMLAGLAGAADQDDLRDRRDQARRDAAAAAAEVDAVQGDHDEVAAALRDLERDVAAEQADLADVERRLAEAEQIVANARAAERETVERIDELEAQLRDFAVSAYIDSNDVDAESVLAADSAQDATRRQTLTEFAVGDHEDMVDTLRAEREDLALVREQAEEAAAQVEQERVAVTDQLAAVEAARARQAGVVAEVEARLDARLAEAAALEGVADDLSAEIRREEQQVAAEAARASSRPSGGSGGSSGGGQSATVQRTGNPSLVTVGGITVSSQIGDQLSRLLNAASAAGIGLAGGGYRDPSSQIALRRAHCGWSDWAVYQAPASSCSPPTARPGSSMHEQGLAVDFTYNGRIISSRSSPAFQWLAANAAAYGFFNLPSEPWHWSVNGR
ncbi:MAG: D-alanyl-D-alanine carboxypeptidase family protein [Actinomycetota bacterium]|nr:D-alanyl-D-alanine carboxypeptidase family protein [Actinomycetota bacterium]